MTVATELERYLLELMNQERAAVGLAPLTLELNLNTSADAHSNWISTADTFSHTGVNGTSSNDRIVSAGFDLQGAWSTGENIGAQSISGADSFFDEVQAIHIGLMNSDGHRANILDENYTHVGLGIITGPLTYGESGVFESVIVTQNFGVTAGTVDLDLLGSTGAEVLRGSAGNDHISGAEGNDTLSSSAGTDTIYGGVGNDSINGGGGNDDLMGEAGNDFLRGGNGRDAVSGDAGADTLRGDGGSDTLEGGAGNDDLAGGDGNDSLSGGDGFDTLLGDDGDDTLEGGERADNLFANEGNDYLNGGAGFDRLFGGTGNDTLEGGDGPDALYGSDGDDFIYGQNGDDRSYAGRGDDFIQSGDGNDLIQAGGGFDTIEGGAGDDLLYGRYNADTFVFSDAPGGFGNDTIGDFAVSNRLEHIDLSGVAAISNFNDLMNNHIEQIGADVLITAGEGSTILIEDVNLEQLNSSEFAF